MDSSFNPLGNNSGAGRINPNGNKQPQQPDVQPKAQEQTPPQAAPHAELSEQVMAQLAWIAKSGERSVELGRIEKLLKKMPIQEKISELCQQVNDCFEEEFNKPCSEEFAALVTANLLIGQPSIAGVGADE